MDHRLDDVDRRALPATALVFVSFLGYAKVATVAEELRNAGRNLPLAIVESVAIVIIYAVLVTTMLGVIPWPELSLDAPVVKAAEAAFPGAVGWYFLYARRHTEHQGLLGRHILDRSEEFPDAAVSAASTVRPDGGRYRVMVPLANPRTERDLIKLASVMAKARGGTVEAVHVVTVPDQIPLSAGAEHVDQIDAESAKLLARAREDAETFGVEVETRTIISHRSVEEVFDAARDHRADLVVMGWGDAPFWSAGRVEGTFDELARELPCDFLVLNDEAFDPSRVLVPTAGGSDSDLSAEVASVLLERGSEVSLLHVVDDESERAAGEKFLREWAVERGLEEADVRVDTSGDVEGAIGRHAAEMTTVIVGATERGLLSRLLGGSLVYGIVDEVDCSVLLAERPSGRSLFERLFGR